MLSSIFQVILLALPFYSNAAALPLEHRSVPGFVFAGDAPFSVAAETLAAALTCPNGNPTAAAPPVLLVHGTGTTGKQTWGSSYVPALQANGYTPCYVTLPARAMGDMQVSSEYVAYALHMTSHLAGGQKTAVISHSQGGPDTQWALRFWPSARKVTSSFIALAPDFAGVQLLDSKLSSFCNGDDLCQAALWQQSEGSNFYNALHASEFEALVPTTSLWTGFVDGVVEPSQTNAQLPNATVISAQQLCPGRFVTHMTMPVDAAMYALALDALSNGGVASLSRVRQHAFTTCLSIYAPHMSNSVVSSLKNAFNDLIDGFLLGSKRITAEPPVMAYALTAQ